jgi:cytochrome c553
MILPTRNGSRIAILAVILAAAGPPPPGASSCSGCHGSVPPPPTLAGRDAGEIVAALDAFRAGSRPATVMDRIAKGFTHDEALAIAAWWAGQR